MWFVMSQTDCSPRANGLFAPEPTDCSPRPAGRPDNPPASQAKVFFGKGSEESRLRNRKSKFHKFLPSHPLFFWKWEGYFAAQEQNVGFHDFIRFASILCLKTFHETLYIYVSCNLELEKILPTRGSHMRRPA